MLISSEYIGPYKPLIIDLDKVVAGIVITDVIDTSLRVNYVQLLPVGSIQYYGSHFLYDFCVVILTIPCLPVITSNIGKTDYTTLRFYLL